MNKTIGASLLVAGTSIGGGMLALPVMTAMAGFIPTMITLTAIWALMCFTGLLLLEVNLWCEPGADFVKMARRTLGATGANFAWLCYLLLLYALLAAYISAGAVLMNNFFNTLGLGDHLRTGALVFTSIFGMIVFFGVTTTDYFNRALLSTKVLTFCIFILFIVHFVKPKHLVSVDVKYVVVAIPIIVTSFGYHIVIPAIRKYLECDVKRLRISIILGSALPLLLYLLWEMIALGALPLYGTFSLKQVFSSENSTTGLITVFNHFNNSVISYSFLFFVNVAVTTSFLGVTLSLVNFISDNFHWDKQYSHRFKAIFLALLPPLLLAIYYPEGFVMALNYGAICVALLLLLLPSAMVFAGRYKYKFAGAYQAPGGAMVLSIPIIVTFIVIALDIAAKLHVLPVPFAKLF